MYAKLLHEEVKVVHRDGTNVCVTKGELVEWNEEFKTICVFSADRQVRVYIPVDKIDKLEAPVGD
jgi:hypothetical protein